MYVRMEGHDDTQSTISTHIRYMDIFIWCAYLYGTNWTLRGPHMISYDWMDIGIAPVVYLIRMPYVKIATVVYWIRMPYVEIKKYDWPPSTYIWVNTWIQRRTHAACALVSPFYIMHWRPRFFFLDVRLERIRLSVLKEWDVSPSKYWWWRGHYIPYMAV